MFWLSGICCYAVIGPKSDVDLGHHPRVSRSVSIENPEFFKPASKAQETRKTAYKASKKPQTSITESIKNEFCDKLLFAII